MNLLLLHWGAYTQRDLELSLTAHHIHFTTLTYQFTDKNKDDYFYNWFSKKIMDEVYDAVLTVNYFPLIAEICFQNKIKYLSWCYDCPLNVYAIEETLGYETNFVFLFDKIQMLSYKALGYDTVYHLPLAVNTKRLNQITLNSTEKSTYSSAISFVGNLYQSAYSSLVAFLSPYTKGYLDSIAEAQRKLYGSYIIDDLLTASLVTTINEQLKNSVTEITKPQLEYALAAHTTHTERLILLKALSDRFPLYLYCKDRHPLFSDSIYKGTVDYYTEMPKVFKASKINLNITVKNTQSGIPLRALDIMGCGGFLMSNYQPELFDYFIPDTDFVFYDSMEDALEKSAFYLSHNELRRQIANNGYKKCAESFDYKQILHKIFSVSKLLY